MKIYLLLVLSTFLLMVGCVRSSGQVLEDEEGVEAFFWLVLSSIAFPVGIMIAWAMIREDETKRDSFISARIWRWFIKERSFTKKGDCGEKQND